MDVHTFTHVGHVQMQVTVYCMYRYRHLHCAWTYMLHQFKETIDTCILIHSLVLTHGSHLFTHY